MPKKVWLLIIGMLVNTMGNSFLWPLNTIYMHDELGKSLTVAGLVLLANSGAGVIGNMLGGYLFDRIGGYKTILTGISLSILVLIGLVFLHGWPHFVWFLTILGFSGGIIFPSMYAMVGTVWPEGGRKAFNAIYLSQNVGVAIGPSLAGLVAEVSFDYIFLANLIMYVFFFMIAYFGYKKLSITPERQSKILREGKNIGSKAPLYALLIACIGFALVWLAYSQWTTTISTYTRELGISLKEYSLLWTINGLLIVVGQPLIKPIVKRIEDRLKTQIIFGISIIIVSFIVVAYAKSFTMFAVAMVILTFGEMFIFPAVPALANQLAPKGREGYYQGIVNSAATTGRMLGPFVGGVLVDQFGMKWMFLILTVLIAFGIFTTLLYDRPLKNYKEKPEIPS